MSFLVKFYIINSIFNLINKLSREWVWPAVGYRCMYERGKLFPFQLHWWKIDSIPPKNNDIRKITPKDLPHTKEHWKNQPFIKLIVLNQYLYQWNKYLYYWSNFLTCRTGVHFAGIISYTPCSVRLHFFFQSVRQNLIVQKRDSTMAHMVHTLNTQN